MHSKTLILAATALLMLCIVSALPVQQDEAAVVAVKKITADSSSSSEEGTKDQNKQADSSGSSEEQLIQKRSRRQLEDDLDEVLDITRNEVENEEVKQLLSLDDDEHKDESMDILSFAENDDEHLLSMNRIRRDASSEESPEQDQPDLPTPETEENTERETVQQAEQEAEQEPEQEAEKEAEQQAEHEPTESQVTDDLVEPHDALINLEDYAQGCEVTEVDSKEVDNETTYAE